MKIPSIEHGCKGKTNLGRGYVKQAEKMARKHGKSYGVYECPHCHGFHLTTKQSEKEYDKDLLYWVDNPSKSI